MCTKAGLLTSPKQCTRSPIHPNAEGSRILRLLCDSYLQVHTELTHRIKKQQCPLGTNLEWARRCTAVVLISITYGFCWHILGDTHLVPCRSTFRPEAVRAEDIDAVKCLHQKVGGRDADSQVVADGVVRYEMLEIMPLPLLRLLLRRTQTSPCGGRVNGPTHRFTSDSSRPFLPDEFFLLCRCDTAALDGPYILTKDPGRRASQTADLQPYYTPNLPHMKRVLCGCRQVVNCAGPVIL